MSRHETPYRYVAHPVYLNGLEELAASGRLEAFEGIDRIQTLDGTRSLTRLLSSENMDVVHASALFLIRRMPVRTVDGVPRAWRWWPTPEERAPYEALWLEDARAPLLEAGRKLVRSAEVEHVQTGAFVIESLGTPEDAALVIEALATTMRGLRNREGADADIIGTGAADGLIAALAGLRERGYRAPRSGGIGVVLAQLLEWAEPGAERRPGWEDMLEAFIAQQPHLLRQAALRALPTPTAGSRWERVLLAALDDRDLGVLNDRMALVQAGQPVPVTEDEARDLFGGLFAFTLEGNREWPADSVRPPRPIL